MNDDQHECQKHALIVPSADWTGSYLKKVDDGKRAGAGSLRLPCKAPVLIFSASTHAGRHGDPRDHRRQHPAARAHTRQLTEERKAHEDKRGLLVGALAAVHSAEKLPRKAAVRRGKPSSSPE